MLNPIKTMACPYVAEKCSGRGEFTEVQHKIFLSTSGRGINLKPRSLGQREVCFYEISGGTPTDLKVPAKQPVNDEYLTISFVAVSNVKVYIIIAESLKSDYVD